MLIEGKNIRKAAVAGRFYPSDKEKVIEIFKKVEHQEQSRIKKSFSAKKLIGGIVPHAGYIYSGFQAVHFFKILALSKQIFDTVFIINPNHTGIGDWISLEEHTHWESPLGVVSVDSDFNNLLDFPKNKAAHQYEHSGEVMLPFLQYYLPYSFEIVPITIGEQTYENAKILAQAIFTANEKLKKRILLIASSDFSHFESVEQGFRKDQKVVDTILKNQISEIEKIIHSHRISVCGYAPIMCLLEYAQLISEKPQIELLARGHSGMVHKSEEVVDYISFLSFE